MKRDIIYSDGVLYYPLPEEGMYSVLVAQKDNSYKATGKIISIKEVRKEINAKKKASTETKVGPVDNSKKKSADARKMAATLSDAVNAIKKKASTLPSQKEIDAVMASVMRQSLFGDKVIPNIVSTLAKIYKSVDKANQSIVALERTSQQYGDPNYIRSQVLKFNVAIAKKDKEIAVIESKRLALDTSSSNYTAESAELDLKESMVMSRFASEVERMNDPLLSLRRNIVNRMDAMVSTIKSVTNSVNKLSNISVPNVDNRKLREIGRTINKTYAEAFRLLQNVNNGISIETIKASMGWKESGVNRYVTVTRYDDAGKPYNVYLTKKEFDQKTGQFTDKRVENPDYFVPHFEAEDAMTMVGSFISKVMQLTSSINKLGKTKIESPIKTSIRLRTLARQMNRLVKTTAKSFSDIDSASLRYAITSLVGNETTITSTTTEQGRSGSVEQINRIMTTKQPGVIGAINMIIGTLNTLSNVDLGHIFFKILKLRMKLKVSGPALRGLMRTLLSVFPASKDKDPKNGLDYNEIYGNAGDVFRLIGYLRDSFEQIDADFKDTIRSIEDLSTIGVKNRHVRRARRHIKKLILRYSSILDTIIETLNSKDLQSKRTKCSYVIHNISTDLEAIVKMIDEMSALKQLSKKGTISKRRIDLIKDSVIGLRDMLAEIAAGYNGKIIEEGAITVKAVSGTIPVFVSDIIFILNNERKLKGKEGNIKNMESVMREYSRLLSIIVKMLSSYKTTDVSKIDNITVVLMSLTASMPAFKKLSDSGKGFDDTDIYAVEMMYRLFSGKRGMLQLTFMLSSGIVKISKTGIGKVKEKVLLMSIDKISSFLDKLYKEFGYKKSQDKYKKSIDGLIEANKVVEQFLEIEKNLAIIGLLFIPAEIGALGGTLVMVTTRMLIRTIRKTDVDGKGDKTTLEKGRDMLLVLGVVIQIEKELSIIGLLAIPATIGALAGTLVMVTTRMLIRTIRKTDVDGKGDKTTLRKALDMMLVLGAVVLIETELSVIGLLAVPAMVGVGLGTLVVLSLRILIRTISRTNLDGLGIKKGAVGKVMDMLLVVSAIGLIELELIAVGILAIPALIGAAAMGLVILGFSAIVVTLYVFKKNLAIGALVLAGICLALLLVGETFYALSSALKEWDWNLLWKIPLLVLDMAVPFLVLGIPVVAGLVALGAIVTIAIIYTYKEMIETVSKLKDINVEAAKKTISSTSEIIETMMSSLAKTSLWDFAQTEMSIINIRGTIENYSRIIDLVEKIADLKVPTGYDSEGNPTGYERANPSVFKDAKTTIKQLSGIMAFMTKELLSMDRAGSLGDYIGGKWKMGIVSRTAEPINRILDFIVKLNGPYRMPIYKTDENGNDVLDTSVGDKGYKQINIGTFIRTNSRPIMRTVKDLFKFAGNIGAMVQKMGQGEDTLVDTWRGKVRLKIISRALDPLNSVLDFIVKLNNVYDIPVYKKEDGREVLDTSVGNKGYIQTNLSSFLKQSKPDILNTIKDLMEFVTEIGDKIVTLGGGEEEDDGVFFGLFSKKNRDTRRGKRRLKVIAEAVDPLQSVLDFIVTMETGVVDVPVIKDGKIVMDEDGKTALTRPEKISTLVSRQKDAEKNVMQLVGVAIAIGNVVSRIANSGSAVKNIDEDAMSKVAMISEVISPLTEYATMFSTMKGQSPDLFKKDSADSMVSMTTDIVESVNKMFSLEILTSNKFKEKDGRIGSLYNRIKDFTELKHTKDFKNAVESTGDMVDSINSINDSKIDKLNTLMRNMIEFGNTMDEALENVFDKIVELAEELHYIIEANEKKQNPQDNNTENLKPSGTQQTGTQQKQTVQQGTIQQRIDTSGVETRIDDLITIVTQIRQNILRQNIPDSL